MTSKHARNETGRVPTEAEITAALLDAGVSSLPDEAAARFHSYLELLLRWNQRINLISDRDPARVLDRHLVECAFVAMRLPGTVGTVLDYGSGAGLPGIPIAICRPQVHVVLAESSSAKAAFLEEAIRVLGVEAEVYYGRVESMPEGQQFDAVTLRAVDRTDLALRPAAARARQYLVWMTTDDRWAGEKGREIEQGIGAGFAWTKRESLPLSRQRIFLVGKRLGVPD